MHMRALEDYDPAVAEPLRNAFLRLPSPETIAGRAVLSGQTGHILDVKAPIQRCFRSDISHLSPKASLPSMLSAQTADEDLMRLEGSEVLDATTVQSARISSTTLCGLRWFVCWRIPV